ncbi:PH domain-containing protein, partial [Erysipelatoclostridium ramosum]|nr:PH domain-containing protein [Thomasclavelia ramosa]
KNTIGLKNISNVNTEQNLLEMLLGTCKVKLDTNSMSTSDKTDVKIILKKAEAEQFRLYVMKLMQGQEGDFEEEYSKE